MQVSGQVTDYIAIELMSDFATGFLRAGSLVELKDKIRSEEPPLSGTQVFIIYRTLGTRLIRMGTATRQSDLVWSKGVE